MSSDINILLRSMRQLVPNSETSAILSTLGVSYWAYDPIAQELCWQRTDVTSVRGYRVAKFTIQQALQFYAQPDRKRFMQLISDAVHNGLSSPIQVTMKTEAGTASFELVAALVSDKKAPLIVGLMKECRANSPSAFELPNFLKGLSHVFVSSPAAVLMTDSKGVIRFANQAFLRSFAIKNAKHIIGRDVRTIPNHLGKRLVVSFSDLLENNKEIQGSLQLPQAAGQAQELQFRLHPLELSHPHGGCIFVGEANRQPEGIDATNVLDAVPTPILVADLGSRRIIYANKAGRGELGLSATQIGTERLSDKLMSAADVRDLTEVLESVGWDAGRVWQVESHIGLKRHYRIRSCFIGERTNQQIVLEFLPVRKAKDKPANEKAQNFFTRLLDLNLTN